MNISSKKIDAEFFKQKKKDILFTASGIVLLLILLWVFISSISFLSLSVDTAIDNQAVSDTNTKFNIDSLQKLGIMGAASTTTSLPSTSSPR